MLLTQAQNVLEARHAVRRGSAVVQPLQPCKRSHSIRCTVQQPLLRVVPARAAMQAEAAAAAVASNSNSHAQTATAADALTAVRCALWLTTPSLFESLLSSLYVAAVRSLQ
jgi:hypothetical protein